MDNCAPVLIPTLNRHVHFKRCVESLSACTHADKTDLYVAFDYPLTESHRDGYSKINEYLPTIKRFKSVNIIRREKNFGAIGNMDDAMKSIFEKYDRMIFSEDDNEFSPDFLNFVNQGLNLYKDNQNVFSISGYQYPVSVPESYKKNTYVWQGFSAWGVGIWKDKFLKVDWDQSIVQSNIKKFLKKPLEVYRHYRIANHLISNKIRMVKNNCIYGDSYLSWYLVRNNMYVVFPTISRVRNTGHDGSGVHCGNMTNNPYREQEIYSGDQNYTLEKDIQPDNDINQVLYYFFSLNFKSKIKLFARLFLYNFDTFIKSRNFRNMSL